MRRGSSTTASSRWSRTAPSRGPGSAPSSRDEVVTVDRQIAPVERDLGRELVGDPPPKLREPARVGIEAAADIVGAPELEQLVEGGLADLRDEPADRGVARDRLVREHVLADQVDDPVGRRPRELQPSEQGVGEVGPTESCPRKRPSANVAGFPMSWTSAASRTIGRSTGAASTVRTV